MNKSKNGHLPVQLEEQMPVVINPMDAPVSAFKTGLDRRKTNRNALIEWIRDSLVEGRDYGSVMIKGKKSKPSLLKPGAEKICGMLGLIPTFPNLSRFEESALAGKTINAIILKCELTNQNGTVVGEGVGARFVEQQDKGDLNKALKMAVKSAMIDAVLRCAGLSEIFTQDLEEKNSGQRSGGSESESVTEKQLSTLMNLLEDTRVNKDEKRKLSSLVNSDLTKEKAGEILDYFFGVSEYKNGEWVKVAPGVLDHRVQDDDSDENFTV
ncbi:MAG: hypothetical protein ISR95_03500 [Candidatus Marinimicrobia bacterium]|nr:hypothetical protein [Candidatus Brocadiales bacterium]MBL7046680.1 hypothetical protein [Candidatus Neomarinimicrobiota bacterium]